MNVTLYMVEIPVKDLFQIYPLLVKIGNLAIASPNTQLI